MDQSDGLGSIRCAIKRKVIIAMTNERQKDCIAFWCDAYDGKEKRG